VLLRLAEQSDLEQRLEALEAAADLRRVV
jgi:hypothetical protein